MKCIVTFGLMLALSGLLNAAEVYKGYSDDRALLRATTEIPSGLNSKQKIKASSGQANQAARRIFSRISFLFKSRKEVLAILGDPATISDYGVKAEPKKDADLVYRFDSGFGGSQYTIRFRDGGVWSVQVEGLE